MFENLVEKHPEQKEILKLSALLDEAGWAYYFSLEEELRPTPFNHDGEDTESINWDTFPFEISVLEDGPDSAVDIVLKDKLLNVSGVADGLTAEEAFEELKKIFNK